VLRKLDKKHKDGHALYEVECIKCGFKQVLKISDAKKRSNSTSCNTHRKNTVSMWKSKRLCGILNDMIQRCYNPNNRSYRNYGAKFIMVCYEWRHDHKSFEDWAYANGYNDSLTIDRINAKLGYYPSNCRWISLEDNSRWKSTTNAIEVDGIIDTGRGWSSRLDLGVNHINRYLRKYGYEETVKYIKKLIRS